MAGAGSRDNPRNCSLSPHWHDCPASLLSKKEKKVLVSHCYHIWKRARRRKDGHDQGKHFSQRSQFLFAAPLASPFVVLTLNSEMASRLLTT